MHNRIVISLALICFVIPCHTFAQQRDTTVEDVTEHIIALEQSALDRWIAEDPDGYLAVAAPEITYFEPNQDRRVDGLEEFAAAIAPLRGMRFPFTRPRYQIIEPKVQLYGDVALLTFNVVLYAIFDGHIERVVNRWNSTEIHRRVDANWQLVHSHWSHVKPIVRTPL